MIASFFLIACINIELIMIGRSQAGNYFQYRSIAIVTCIIIMCVTNLAHVYHFARVFNYRCLQDHNDTKVKSHVSEIEQGWQTRKLKRVARDCP